MEIRQSPVRFRAVPLRRPAPASSSPFDILALVDELRKMHGDFKTGLSMVEKALQTFDAVKKGAPGIPGAPGTPGRAGSDGRSITQADVDAAVGRMLVQPENGVAPTVEAVAGELLKQPKLYKILKKMLRSENKSTTTVDDAEETSEAEAVKAFVEEKIAGVMKVLEGKVAEVRNYAAMNSGLPAGGLAGKKYGEDTWARGGGDIVEAGTNVTITTTANGKKRITVTPAALSIIAIGGTIDDNNVTFTALSQPTLLNINGSFYQKTGGTFTWSYAAGTITLNNAVGTGGSIFGV